jgi:hypothetical protein
MSGILGDRGMIQRRRRAIARLYCHWRAHQNLALGEVLSASNIRMVAELDLYGEYDPEIDAREPRDAMLERPRWLN